MDVHRSLFIKDQFSEPHKQHQNPVEGCAVRWLKSAIYTLMDRVGAPDSAWFLCLIYLIQIWNITWHPKIGMTPKQVRHGVTPDISAHLQHAFWDRVLYLDHEDSWAISKDRTARYCYVAENVGDALTFWLLDKQSKKLIARSVV